MTRVIAPQRQLFVCTACGVYADCATDRGAACTLARVTRFVRIRAARRSFRCLSMRKFFTHADPVLPVHMPRALAMGTSFQELLDETRRARAEEWLRFTDMKLEQVSRQLGFGDIRSFRRAFKRWTGRTPTEIRRGADKDSEVRALRAPGSAVTAVTSCLMTRVRTSRGAWRHVRGLQLPLPWSASMRASRRSRCSLRARGIVGPSFSKNSP